jgi:hypothetical protein
MEKETEVVQTGRDRAYQRMLDLKEWQDQYYSDLATRPMSRQFRRYVRRITAKKAAALQRKEAVWGSPQKGRRPL